MGGGYEHCCQVMLDAVLHRAAEPVGGMTGAMHQCVIIHLVLIRKDGYDAWLAGIEAREPGRIYTWDGTEESCPVTELSLRMEKPA